MKNLFIGQLVEVKVLSSNEIIKAKILDLSIDLYCEDDHPIWIKVDARISSCDDFWINFAGVDVDYLIEIQNGKCEY